uniref:Caspase recruitment domain-containing protein 14 n=1 Tax=Gadus morhua TaxID=8049 RepID=A0A8C5BZY8_GADMO
MAGECVIRGTDLKELDEEGLWELINDHRHRISLGVRPCMLIPYLRQARVLSELDEDEILSCHNLHNRSMRTSYMLDLLRTQGRNGGVALLESLMIHYPCLYTQVTGQKPSTEPSKFSGLIKYSELTEYLVRAVTGMQKELQEARNEAGRQGGRCTALQAEMDLMTEAEEKSRRFSLENEHMRRQLAAANRELTKLKDERCDLYVRHTAAIEEKSAVNIRSRDLTLQVRIDKLDMHDLAVFTPPCTLPPQAYASRDEAQAQISRSLADKDTLRSQIVELQERLFSCQGARTPTTVCSAPPFLMRSRPKAVRLFGRVLTISFQGKDLLAQLSVVGGNKTGVFVSGVAEGSAAQTVGISPGAQIVEHDQQSLSMVLQDSTLEEALWALGQVRGLCHLSLRSSQDAYESLLQRPPSGAAPSGDSFYVRVNMAIPRGPGGPLAVACNDILHVTNTCPPGGKSTWEASHVHPSQLSSTGPPLPPQRGPSSSSTSNPAPSLLFPGEAAAAAPPRGCVTLMPYTLVTPHYPPVCRPVLVLPTVLGRVLDEKLACWQGFQLCEPGEEAPPPPPPACLHVPLPPPPPPPRESISVLWLCELCRVRRHPVSVLVSFRSTPVLA